MTRDRGAFVLLGLAVAAVVFVAFAVGYELARSRAVCHSVTEDSVIADCDYVNGEWRPE